MKKIKAAVLALAIVLLAACGGQEAYEPILEPPETELDTQQTQNPQDENNLVLREGYEWCDACGEYHYEGQEFRNQTPPLNIRESHEIGEGFLDGFTRRHEATYIQWETDWEGNGLIFWADEPLSNITFMSLAHDWLEGDSRIYYSLQNIIFSLDELLVNEAIVLNVGFAHYLQAHAGVIFTDQSGNEHRMLLLESMRGGCYPHYFLSVYEPNEWWVWN